MPEHGHSPFLCTLPLKVFRLNQLQIHAKLKPTESCIFPWWLQIPGKRYKLMWDMTSVNWKLIWNFSELCPAKQQSDFCWQFHLQPHSASNTLDSPLHLSLCPHSFPHVGAVTLYLSPANSYFKPQPRIVSSGGSSPDPINQLPEDLKFPFPSHQVPLLGGWLPRQSVNSIRVGLHCLVFCWCLLCSAKSLAHTRRAGSVSWIVYVFSLLYAANGVKWTTLNAPG